MPDFKGFGYAILTDWVSLMSGIASVILVIVGFVKHWDAVPRWAIIITAAVCFFIAGARVWTTQNNARITAEKKLEELTAPKLGGYIEGIAVAPANNPPGTILTVMATITN